jgi:hypothetical protein
MTPPATESLPLLPLDESNPTPLYLQLQQSIEEAVRKGAIKKAPSNRTMLCPASAILHGSSAFPVSPSARP